MFIETQMGDIVNSDKIVKIVTNKTPDKWILAAVFSNGVYSYIGEFNNTCEFVKYKERINALLGTVDLRGKTEPVKSELSDEDFIAYCNSWRKKIIER